MALNRLRLSMKLALLLFLPCALDLAAITYDDLRRQQDLTPQSLAAHFAKFEFQFRGKIQSVDRFLKSQSGDCDDFATLADALLRERGYTTRLLAIRMNDIVHVVCYVKEAGGYLDYNLREVGGFRKCEEGFEFVAARVGEFYQRRWTSVSHFTYERGMKQLVSTIKDEPRIFLADTSGRLATASN